MLGFLALLILPATARAAKVPLERPFMIEVTSGTEKTKVEADEIRGRIWVNFSKIAPFLGARRREADGGELWEFPAHQILFWKDLSTFRIRNTGKKAWSSQSFERNMFYDGASAMVPLSSLPALCRRSFSYHRQKDRLTVDDVAESAHGRRVSARHQRQDGNDWVSLEDAANALGIVMFKTQSNQFRLVMPDFSILELRTGDNTVFQRNSPYARLPDPMLLFDGSPFLTTRALRILLGTDLQWDAADGSLIVPARYGRIAQAAPSINKLSYRGYAAEPFSMKAEEISTFYQEPMPVFAADHAEVYESVRDLLTDEPIHHRSSVADRVSGNAVLSLNGNTGGIPFSGRGAFEKIGDKTHVVNGSVRWGFPVLQVEGGRQYLTFGGLNNQFNVIDGVTVSHSNDHFGDGDMNPELSFKAGYGQHDFSIYLSTAEFSQTVRMKQKFITAGADGEWEPANGQRFSARINHYSIDNEELGVDSSFFDESLLKEIFGDDFVVAVEKEESAALTRSILSHHHDTTLFNAVYDAGRLLQLSSSVGLSRYTGDHGTVYDTDSLGRIVAGSQKRRLDVSFERSGANYRALGDPSRYQARKIFRIAPSYEIARPWRVLGEFRREDSGALKKQGGVPYTNKYAAFTNLLTYRPGTIRATLTDYDSSLYGGRRSGDVNLTKNIGRDSAELGGEASVNRLANGSIFRRSRTARAGYQILRPGKRLSLGQEFTWHDYPAAFVHRRETQSTFLTEIAHWRALMQYGQAPRSYLSTDVIHTGLVSAGRRLSDSRLLNVFYSAASERANLSHPSAWRSGIELVTTFE